MLKATSVGGGVELQCSVVGYQFPESPRDDWCLVKVELEQGAESFEKQDPALEAPDLLTVRDWFDCLSAHRLPRRAHLGFIEPCLAFEYISRNEQGVRFGLRLGAELTPPFPLRQFGEPTTDWRIVFELSATALCTVVAELDTAIARFPRRSLSA